MKIKAGQKMSFVVEGHQPKSHFTLRSTGCLTVKEDSTIAQLTLELKEYFSNEEFKGDQSKMPFPEAWIKVKELKLITT